MTIIDEICVREGDVVKTQEGVVAELDGKYWGVQYEDGHSTCYDFGPVENAHVSSSRYCHKPTDMTYKDSPYTQKLSRATLKKIRITNIYAVGK